MSDVIPPNDHVSYPGDQPWHVPFPSPPETQNNDPTSSGSDGKLDEQAEQSICGEVKQTMKAKSRSAKLDSLKLKLEETKKDVVHKFTESEEFNRELVECFNNGFEMFRNYTYVVSPYYNWSKIDVAGVWDVLNRCGQGMADHSLVHAARKKTKDMDLLMDL
ncbi:hypothetical protein L3X38_018628 [Prunus dulcis]|uniref:Uncharacterized protein n=1 Tax=Prunus dulcis TaxID=3755 RepID=A0AAD4WA42_PRUDU|nr:hypothetical protein L3X38_018628 [Prunus dulcis]